MNQIRTLLLQNQSGIKRNGFITNPPPLAFNISDQNIDKSIENNNFIDKFDIKSQNSTDKKSQTQTSFYKTHLYGFNGLKQKYQTKLNN
jgi:hypothetical protein